MSSVPNMRNKFFHYPIFRKKGRPPPNEGERRAVQNQGYKKLPDDAIAEINKEWTDNERTGLMWEIIKKPDPEEFMEVLSSFPEIAHIRSKDGRGPMFWAHEYGRKGMISVLRKLGVREDLVDANGIKPTDITHSSIRGVI